VDLLSIMSTGHVNQAKVIECLRELADYNYQQRVWIGSSPGEISSLTELSQL
jgi:hypothetical protein